MLEKIYENVIKGNIAGVTEGIQEALATNQDPSTILNQGMIAAMEEVGRRFENEECYIPEMLIAARAMQSGLSILRPRLIQANIEPIGKVVMGTVKGDLHDIGKNLVGMMLEGVGFEIVDVGTSVAADQFIEAIETHQPKFVGMSALLTTTMPEIGTTIKEFQKAGVRDQITVMIGGAPIDQKFADEVGADLYAPDAAAAANKTKMLL